ncbi:MAG: hypothetical protein AVDCRST_MAG40-2982, partial [uncultured Gemmatimonadaceae bacterium]
GRDGSSGGAGDRPAPRAPRRGQPRADAGDRPARRDQRRPAGGVHRLAPDAAGGRRRGGARRAVRGAVGPRPRGVGAL